MPRSSTPPRPQPDGDDPEVESTKRVSSSAALSLAAILLLAGCSQDAQRPAAEPAPAPPSAQPAASLQGTEWVVERLGEAPLVEGSRVTLRFGAEGRLSGKASCNGYSAGYTLEGQRLTVSQPASTRMACAEPLMEQEQRFFELLEGTQRYELTPDGLLRLHAGEGRSIQARRSAG